MVNSPTTTISHVRIPSKSAHRNRFTPLELPTVEPWGKDPMCLDQKEQNLMISVSVEPKLNFLQLVFCWFSISKLSGTRVVLRCFFFQFQVTTSSGGNFRGQLSQDLWAADSDESE